MARNSLEGLRVIGLARQSRTRDDSASVAEQIEQLQDECERQGATLVEVYTEEDVSGQRPLDRRHGLKQAVADIEDRRGDVLVVAYFDRLVRSLKTQAEVVERVEAAKGRVVTLDVGEISNGTAAQWLSGTMLGMVSEYYARSVGERVAESKQENIDKGVPPFPRITPAYQRRADGTLELHPVNAPILREAVQLRLAGMSYTKLARWLADRGIKITPSAIEGLFSSRLLIGEIHFGNFTPNLHAIEEPLLDPVTFRRLQKMRATKGRYGKSERLLARLGVLHCATCGARMIASTTRGNKGTKSYDYYRCGDRLCPGQASVSCDLAEQIIRDEAVKLSADRVGRASAVVELEQARLALVAADERLGNAIRTLAGLAGETATKETLDELQAERDAAAEHHARLASIVTPDRTVSTAADWNRLSFDGKRDVIRAVIARAIVTPGRGSGRVAIESREVLSK
jgi:site-specific DNA recombinase